MKPGSVVRIRPEKNFQTSVTLLVCESISCLKYGQWPLSKKIPKNEIGFVVTIPDPNNKGEMLFDWLVEVSFPDSKLQGLVQKANLEILSL